MGGSIDQPLLRPLKLSGIEITLKPELLFSYFFILNIKKPPCTRPAEANQSTERRMNKNSSFFRSIEYRLFIGEIDSSISLDS